MDKEKKEPETQEPDSVEFEIRPTKSAIIAIVTGIFLITLSFVTYKYFNSARQAELGSGTSTNKEESTTKEETGGADAVTTTPTEKTGEVWVATDYKKGDIKAGKYIVKEGDTLWEISEAVYGNGAMWGKILSSNSDSIGFLPNGSHALITTGQVLTIPNP